MKFTSEVSVEGKGIDSIISKMKTMDNYEATAGFYGKTHPVHGVKDTYIAEVNNYGDDVTPERPFMDTAATHSIIEIDRKMADLMYRILSGQIPVRSTLKELGEIEAKWISQFIITNYFTENAPATIDDKGFDDPLVHTGWMAENVDSKVRKKSV